MFRYLRYVLACTALVLLLGWPVHSLAHAQSPFEATAAQRPFISPFKEEPGLDTWLLAQAYGNTTSAYRQRAIAYGRSQGIHFGIDLSARCGAELVALADGVVFAVDNLRFGSAPHNLIIDFPEAGYAALYGHLLEKPALEVGQEVKKGQVVALSGDPAETCYGRPHLHLEMRDLKTHARKYNPLSLIDLDWDTLSSIGAFGRGFEHDLDEPRKWQSLYDQPEAVSGGPLLNDFANPWPPDVQALPQPPLLAPPDGDPHPQSSLRQLTEGGCCTQPSWAADSGQVLFVDRPTPDAPIGIWGIDIAQPEAQPRLVYDQVDFYSADFSHRIILGADLTSIERIADGVKWTIPAGGRGVSLSPGYKHIAWQVANSEELPVERRVTDIRVARFDGSQARSAIKLPRGGFGGWISDDAILVAGRDSLQAREEVLYAVSLSDGRQIELARAERLRGASVSPGGTWVVYYLVMQDDRTANGLWLVRTDGSGRRQLSRELFGSYRWRDDGRLLVVPFRPGAQSHELIEVDADSGAARPLTDPAILSFKITNNDWAVSPNGRYVAFLNAADHNIWLLTLMD